MTDENRPWQRVNQWQPDCIPPGIAISQALQPLKPRLLPGLPAAILPARQAAGPPAGNVEPWRLKWRARQARRFLGCRARQAAAMREALQELPYNAQLIGPPAVPPAIKRRCNYPEISPALAEFTLVAALQIARRDDEQAQRLAVRILGKLPALAAIATDDEHFAALIRYRLRRLNCQERKPRGIGADLTGLTGLPAAGLARRIESRLPSLEDRLEKIRQDSAELSQRWQRMQRSSGG